MAISEEKKAEFASDPRKCFNEVTGNWFYEDDDGVSYEYIEADDAWFPMYDEKLIESQQSAYVTEGDNEQDTIAPPKDKKKKRSYTYEAVESDTKKQKQDPPKKVNTSVYVTGVPEDATIEELKAMFSKGGVIMENIETGEPKIKIYRDSEGRPKGDVLITYFKPESIPQAITLLDDADLRPGDASSRVRVQEAVFTDKPKPVETKRTSVTAKNKIKKKLEKMKRKLDWEDAEESKKTDKFAKIVVLKNMYTQEDLDASEDPTLLLELKEDVREECEKLGEVTNVILYDKSIGGVMTVRFKEKESAQACVMLMNQRFFAGQQISAEIYDGKTKYLKSGQGDVDDEEEEKMRLERYAKWLEEGGDDNDREPVGK